MKHLFIVNPVAGGKDRHEYVAEQARLALEGSADAYEVYITTAPMDACAKIKAEAASAFGRRRRNAVPRGRCGKDVRSPL